MIRILHVFRDEKFFDGISRYFDSLDDIENIFAFYAKDGQSHEFQYIKRKERVKIISDKTEYLNLFHSQDIQAIYFHGLKWYYWNLFKEIDKNKVVIWWSWGFELYYPYHKLRPLISIDNLYKPLTRQLIESNEPKGFRFKIKEIAKFLSYPLDLYHRNKILKRIDYFTPVIPIEYDLIKQNKVFRAKPFMLYGGPGMHAIPDYPKEMKLGNILVGNSLTYSNNHLDIAKIIRNLYIGERKYIIPISYGNLNIDLNYFKGLMDIPAQNVEYLEKFIAPQEYRTILDGISHAIIGIMRQQAMGNIFKLLPLGVKIFLYKDSLIYKQLKDMGFVVFTIEDDLNEQELSTILSEEEIENNYRVFQNRNESHHIKSQKDFNTIFKSAHQ